ncbi:MAG: HAMP domain-containing histidine kinase, partial [Cyanobacteria bacterium]|nr:HAMP domain-containing histidine kinase [Cyanobacteriota bacterium]
VSHDLRSPLTSVQAGLDLLGSGAGGNLNDMAKEILSQASADIARLLLLTDDLLDAEMLATGKIELRRRDFSVSDLIKQVTQTMNGFAESYEVTIDPVLPSEDFKLHADPDRLSQVLVNLLGNAIKFSAVGSSVSIECKRIDGAARFQVTDRGTGIESKHHATIFDRFIRLSNTDVSGKGLGLAICKSLVELHGGSIGVISSPGEGSTFWFTIALNE